MIAGLDELAWIKQFSRDRPPSKGRPVCQAGYRKTLRVRKSEWSLVTVPGTGVV
jgi:hypothetical protein